ncbi:hypothetical protein CLOM_g5593 [Closterium sp. NIES-68]|nr:hypothetical protein CLOM_g5593 [Closterium sp. NIES-68]
MIKAGRKDALSPRRMVKVATPSSQSSSAMARPGGAGAGRAGAEAWWGVSRRHGGRRSTCGAWRSWWRRVRANDVDLVNVVLQEAPSRTALLNTVHPASQRTALHEAVIASSTEAAGALLEQRDAKQCTALHYACAAGHRGIIKLLLVAGANMYARNRDNLYPQQLASTDRIRTLFRKLHEYHQRHGLGKWRVRATCWTATSRSSCRRGRTTAMTTRPPSPGRGGAGDSRTLSVESGGQQYARRIVQANDSTMSDAEAGSFGTRRHTAGAPITDRSRLAQPRPRNFADFRAERLVGQAAGDEEQQASAGSSASSSGSSGSGSGNASGSGSAAGASASSPSPSPEQVSEEDLKLIRPDWRRTPRGAGVWHAASCSATARPTPTTALMMPLLLPLLGRKQQRRRKLAVVLLVVRVGRGRRGRRRRGEKKEGGKKEESEDEKASPASAKELMGDEPMAPLGTMKWKRGELLGEGAYGKVFLGLNEMTGELMAVKQIKMTSAGDEKAMHIAALEQEIVLYRKMRHRHIVAYIDMEKDESDGSLYIFLEFISGGSIHSMLDKFGKFSESLVRVYTRQLLLGLEYLHGCKIIHRDIKGGNVLVDRDGVIKLADFGASKAFHEGTVGEGCKSIRGSVFWMAPEVIKGEGYGRRADIWSLGCTVIEMLTGSHPWPNMGQHVVGHLPHRQDHHGATHPRGVQRGGQGLPGRLLPA